MHLDRVIVHTYRLSDGLSTGPDDQNTPTRQSVDTNDAPWDPASRPRYKTLKIFVAYLFGFQAAEGIGDTFIRMSGHFMT